MATRSRTTFKKRQKELARMEKQRDKIAKRMQRRQEKHSPESGDMLDGEAQSETADETVSAAPDSDLTNPSTPSTPSTDPRSSS
jgi:hypothetical protein